MTDARMRDRCPACGEQALSVDYDGRDRLMDQTPLDFDRPRARAGDPGTSHQAAASATERTITEMHGRILRLLDVMGPCTDERLAAWYADQFDDPFTPSGLRTRRHELVEMGRVEWTGDTARLTTGRQGRVWRLVSR